MIAVTYTLELLEPFLATGLEGDPNTKRSLDYVPGSMMRGALVYRYLRQTNRSELDADDNAGQRFFMSDATCYLNAYPLAANGCRSLPTPASWLKLKEETLESRPRLFDCAVDPEQLPDGQTETVGKSFCRLDDGTVYLFKPERRISVHTAREPKAGRATGAKGAVFQYDALAPGQKFGGAIVVSRLADAEQLQALLEQGTLRMGGSRSAGYGLVRIGDLKILDGWQETDAKPTDLDAGDELILTCLSPCIARDTMGNLSADLHAADLPDQLGIDPSRLKLDLTQTRRTLTTLGGFNRKWGLPLCQTQAITAGSVFVYRTTAPISVERLRHLQEAGIGERRNEGFGRIGINWQRTAVLRYGAAEPQPTKLAPPVPVIAGSEEVLAKGMAGRLLRSELEHNLAERVQQLRLTEASLRRDLPRNSQLSRVRMIARSALAAGDLARLKTFMGEMRKTAKDQFTEARLRAGNQRLFEWIMERLEHPERVWQDVPKPAEVCFGTFTYAVPDDWCTEYTLRLIDGVLAQANKDKKEQGA